MVGVVGSSPIAPTNILQNTKHPVATLGAFLLVPISSVGITWVIAIEDAHVGFKVEPLSFAPWVTVCAGRGLYPLDDFFTEDVQDFARAHGQNLRLASFF